MRMARSTKYQPLWIALIALIALPFLMRALGLSINTASMVVILAIATMALNLCVGYTGLVSFGHSTWFGIGAYAAGLIQLHWFHEQIWLPILLSMVVVAVLSTAAGVLILRRRGVYFSLLTLALSALTYTVSFRWTEVTGGEDGLSGLKRGTIGPIFLDDGLAFYIVVALIGLGVWVLRPPGPGAVGFFGRWLGKVLLFLGLGLAIVKRLVESMKGRVWCESHPGQGAAFIVELPEWNML